MGVELQHKFTQQQRNKLWIYYRKSMILGVVWHKFQLILSLSISDLKVSEKA
jgi:hypothetical protein